MEYASMGDLINSVRKAKNMTQKELADKLNVTDKAVSKWERGASYPDISTIPKLADILNVSSDELLRFHRQDISAQAPASPAGLNINQIISLVLKAVGLAMGVATLVLSILGNVESTAAISMLAIGLVCIGIVQFRS